jgi:hypothetical protein
MRSFEEKFEKTFKAAQEQVSLDPSTGRRRGNRSDQAQKFNGSDTETAERRVQPSDKASIEDVDLIFETAAQTETKPVAWLWPSRLARGKLTLLAGEPGVGKSQIAVDLAARITRGSEWPDGSRAPRGSVIIISEWRTTLTTYAAPIWNKRLADIETDEVLACLETYLAGQGRDDPA